MSRILAPRGRWSVAALVLSLALAGGSAAAMATSDDHSGLPSDVAFRVDGRNVTVKELNARIATLTALYSLKKPTSGSALSTFNRDAAKSMAVSIILDMQARARGISISAAQAQTGLNTVIQQDLNGDSSQFTAFLTRTHVTQDEVLTEISRTLATGQLYSKITAAVTAPTTAQAQADYNAHQTQMVSPEQRTLSNIVVATEADGNKVIDQLKAGAGFAAVAKAESLDTSTNSKGGALGTVTQSQLDSAYGTAAFAAKDGAVFGPIKNSSGSWYVGRVDAVIPSRQLSFAQVKNTLISALLTQAQTKVWDAWLTKVIVAAAVNYAPAYRPADPNSAPSSAGASSS
ncbi:MAG TPA: peptidyl-prolyl cis-trans isomerase [Marmoricola sp.]|nr:peptidyl-prolyl cis-trans isomerase [Marmoricola sp.]